MSRRAADAQELGLLDGAGHGLDEAADDVFGKVHRWFLEHLGAFRPPGAVPPPAGSG